MHHHAAGSERVRIRSQRIQPTQDGHQVTLEGYGFDGHIHVYGAIDSERDANRSTFSRYQYPSALPAHVLERMEESARRFLEHIGYDAMPFNAEFFWDARRNRIWLLEVNPRISESHCDLFEKVDGASSHEVAVDLALGRAPRFVRGAGPYPLAAKFFLRTYMDAQVERVPGEAEVRRLEERIPGTTIQIQVEPGNQLAALMDQDSYSFCLALVFIGGRDERELLDKFARVERGLDFGLARAA